MATRKARRLNSVAPLLAIPGPELVFGLVGAVGTDLDAVSDALKEQLARVGYQAHVIRLSSLLSQLSLFRALRTRKFPSDFERLQAYMKAGSTLRSRSKRGDILALLSVLQIRQLRQQVSGTQWPPAGSRVAYILRSLKHPAEVKSLRDIYGRAFYLISAYAPRGARLTQLSTQIAGSRHSADVGRFRDQAETLVQMDEHEDRDLGQDVRGAFPLADAFVDASSPPELIACVQRFVELVFGHPFHTPTRDEYAMFHAHAAALRSADLSRQVGAAITTPDGDIIAVGCNDVPKFGGGLYWADDEHDHRDFRVGQDSNVIFKRDLVTQMLERLDAQRLLARTGQGKDLEKRAEALLRDKTFKESIAASVIEFGRAVHAEMAAITDAARRGIALRGTTLFSTTFPCHLCARHIVAAGIRKVIYIEPYPKSVAERLYADSIVVDPSEETPGKVLFRPFVGVAPGTFTDTFRAVTDRKTSTGKAKPWSPVGASPKLRRFVLSYVMIEQQVAGELVPEILSSLGITILQRQGNR